MANGDIGYSQHAQWRSAKVVATIVSVAWNSCHVKVRLAHRLLDDGRLHLYEVPVEDGPSDERKVAVAEEKALFQLNLLANVSRYGLLNGDDVAEVNEKLLPVDVDYGKGLPKIFGLDHRVDFVKDRLWRWLTRERLLRWASVC